jgi:putative hydrolase of HD superfamily
MSCDADGFLEFLLYVGQAKRTFRTGWVLRGVEKVESVADHMYRMAVMSLLLPTVSEESKVRCMKLALVHDLAESVVGDLTEFDGIPKNEKHRRESEAMLYLTSLLPADIGREIFSLFNEYSNQQTTEANLVKDLDIFDMLLQGKYFSRYFTRRMFCYLAYEYEKLQSENGFLEDFFDSSSSKIKTDIVKKWLKKLIEYRSSGKQYQLPSDSNLNTMLKHILYDDQGFYFIYKSKIFYF